MRLTKTLQKSVSLLVALFFSLSALYIPAAQSAVISTADFAQSATDSRNKAELKQLLDREEVKQQLQAMGVAASDVQVRIDALSEEELAQLNANLQELPAGGDILSLAVLVFIVFVITDALGATDLFPFIKPIDL